MHMRKSQAYPSIFPNLAALALRLRKHDTNGCVHIQYVNNKKSSRHRHSHIGYICRRQPRLYQLRNTTPTICNSMQQASSLHRRRACPLALLVPRHAIRSPPNHGRRERLTRALHQQAPSTLTHVRLQSYQNTLLRQAGRGPQTSPTAAYNSRSRPAARLQGTHRQPTFPADRHSP